MTELGIPKAGDRYLLTTGGEQEAIIIEQRDLFFAQIVDPLRELGIPEHSGYVTVETSRLGGELHEWEFTHGHIPERAVERSDDFVHRLVVFDTLLGMVMDRRSDGNFHEVTFWELGVPDDLAKLIHDTYSPDDIDQ